MDVLVAPVQCVFSVYIHCTAALSYSGFYDYFGCFLCVLLLLCSFSNKCLTHFCCCGWWVVYCACLLCFISPVTLMFLRSQTPGLLCLFLEKYFLILFFFSFVAAERWCQYSGRKMSCLTWNSSHRTHLWRRLNQIWKPRPCLDNKVFHHLSFGNTNVGLQILITSDKVTKNTYGHWCNSEGFTKNKFLHNQNRCWFIKPTRYWGRILRTLTESVLFFLRCIGKKRQTVEEAGNNRCVFLSLYVCLPNLTSHIYIYSPQFSVFE